MKTNKLTGAALDWAVAKCEGYSDYDAAMARVLAPRKEYGWVDLCDLNYSTDWQLGGPIIENHIFVLEDNDSTDAVERWLARGIDGVVGCGPTPLIAAMRAYVKSKLGEEVEVPDELS